MSSLRTRASAEDIRRTVQEIVERFHPEKVILFGSYADGTATEDSDVDLLVLLETGEAPLHAAARIAAAIDHAFPLDIVVFTPSEWRASVKRDGVFATEVTRGGVVLHEAGNAGMGRARRR